MHPRADTATDNLFDHSLVYHQPNSANFFTKLGRKEAFDNIFIYCASCAFPPGLRLNFGCILLGSGYQS